MLGAAAKEREQTSPKSTTRGTLARGCRRRRIDISDGSLLSSLSFLHRLWNLRFRLAVGEQITDTGIFGQFGLVIAYTANIVVWRLEHGVGDQNDLRVVARLETLHPVALLVEQIRRDLDRQLGDNLSRPFLARFFANDAQNCQCKRFDAANRAESRASRAGLVARLAERWPQALTRHFHEAETRDFANLNSSPILVYGFAKSVFNFALIFLRTHVNKVDDDKTSEVTQPKLPSDFFRRFDVGVERSRFDVAAFGRACRVDVDRNQCLGMIDDDAAT